jgi:membrane associated rhomboid family serine protease
MTPTTVGMRCPECSKQRTPVHTLRTMVVQPRVTYALIAINVVAFLAEGSFSLTGGVSGTVVTHGVLFGPLIADQHEYWRLITSAFLHENLIHIGFNMYLLYMLGQLLEPALGPVKFATIYFTALLAGSFGALVATPNAPSLGASGAVFGLMGAAALEFRARGISVMQSGIGTLIIINLVLSFTIANISVGAHIGGLIGGGLAALALQAGDRHRRQILGLAACVALAVVAVAGSLAVAGSTGVSG